MLLFFAFLADAPNARITADDGVKRNDFTALPADFPVRFAAQRQLLYHRRTPKRNGRNRQTPLDKRTPRAGHSCPEREKCLLYFCCKFCKNVAKNQENQKNIACEAKMLYSTLRQWMLCTYGRFDTVWGLFRGRGSGPICHAAKGSFPCGGTCRHMVFVVLFPTKRKNKVKSSARRQGKRCLPNVGRTCRKGTS